MISTLRTVGLTKRFGGVAAVSDLSVEARSGEVLGVIGPNGAGKSTLFALLAGALRPSAGRIEVDGNVLGRHSASSVARAGVVRTFQGVNLFEDLTVAENVMVGAHVHHGESPGRALVPGRRGPLVAHVEHAEQVLADVGLGHLATADVGSLSLGHKRVLNLAIALATSPRFLLLDEPLAGLAREEQATVLSVVADLADRGVGVVLVEHNVRSVFSCAGRVIVLDFGVKIAEGAPDEVQRDPKVRETYLGVPAAGPDGGQQ